MLSLRSRREFLKQCGLSTAAFPFLCNLPSFGAVASTSPKQRLVFVFSPNGVIPDAFWPDEEGPLTTFKEILEPLEPFRDRTLTMHGLCDKIRGDGDNHMRGIGCLLTGVELLPGNIQGGSHTPAGWSSGISIDQEIKNYLQSREETQTRFGSLEFGVLVPQRADTWTRMVYSGANKPITPISDPYQMLQKMYGHQQHAALLGSVLDHLGEDLHKVSQMLNAHDRRLLEEQTEFVRAMERELQASASRAPMHAAPELEPGIVENTENLPRLSEMQIELLVHSFQADFARVATLQYTNAVGDSRMKWLGFEEGHHHLSHEPDTNEDARGKLIKINRWYCEQIARLAQRLQDTPEPNGDGSLLDHTTIIWTNELGKGNSHTLDNIPFVAVGGGLGFQMGRSLQFNRQPHNRLLLSLAHAFGHTLDRFGNPDYCGRGPLSGLA